MTELLFWFLCILPSFVIAILVVKACEKRVLVSDVLWSMLFSCVPYLSAIIIIVGGCMVLFFAGEILFRKILVRYDIRLDKELF
jgi:hypothetical protein